jgi:hypothetical protein
MARHIDKSDFRPTVPQTTDQVRVSEQFRRIFGWKPESVQSLAGDRGLGGVYSVKVRTGLCDAIRFTFAQGVLVGIFPKKRGQR